MLDKKISLVGYSGHAYVVGDAILRRNLNLYGYVEKQQVNYNPFCLKYLGNEMDCDFKGWGNQYWFALAIGNNYVRYNIGKNLLLRGENLFTVIDKDACVSTLAEIGLGTFIARGVCVNPFAKIGKMCILNTGSIVEHECSLGEAVHVAPGAVLAGGVSVGAMSFIGANAVVKEGIRIGENVVVGAGAVVVKDILDGTKVIGNPAKKI